jgi:hypothetical protein
MLNVARLIPVLAMLGVAAVSPALAAPRFDTDGPNVLHSGRSSQNTINEALHMPAVQVAMQAFESRGYLRMTEYDYGTSIGDTAVALFAYTIPGIDPAQMQPVITVITRAVNGSKLTDVRGGVIQRVNGELRGVTDPLMPPLHVEIGDMNSSAPGNYSIQGDPRTEQEWASWFLCFFTTCFTCAGANFIPVLGQFICCLVSAVLCHKAIVG